MTPADWRWPLTWRVREGACSPYHLWLYWHWHALLPNANQGAM